MIQAEISQAWVECALDIFMAVSCQAWNWGAERWLEVKHGEKCTEVDFDSVLGLVCFEDALETASCLPCPMCGQVHGSSFSYRSRVASRSY